MIAKVSSCSRVLTLPQIPPFVSRARTERTPALSDCSRTNPAFSPILRMALGARVWTSARDRGAVETASPETRDYPAEAGCQDAPVPDLKEASPATAARTAACRGGLVFCPSDPLEQAPEDRKRMARHQANRTGMGFPCFAGVAGCEGVLCIPGGKPGGTIRQTSPAVKEFRGAG